MSAADRLNPLPVIGVSEPKPLVYVVRPYTIAERQRLVTTGRSVLLSLRLASARFGGEEGIFDFDLAPTPTDDVAALINEVRETSTGPAKKEWALVLARLSGTIADIETWDFPQFSFQNYKNDRQGVLAALQGEFLLAKLRANEAFFRTEMGEKIPTLQYIKDTQGVDPERIGSERLREQRQRVATLFERLGYGEYNAANINAYRADQKLTPDQVEYLVQFHAERFVTALNEFLGLDRPFTFKKSLDPQYTVEIDDKDDSWVGWAKGIRNQYILLLNTNEERHADRWTAGKAEQIALHEVAAHFCQMQGWQNSIDSGLLIPALGVTHIHDPEQITSEGIAQTIQYFIPSIGKSGDQYSSLTPAGLFETEAEALRQMTYNNVHIFVNSQDTTFKQVADYVRRFCPVEPQGEIKKQIKDRKEHPIKRSYLYAYGYGFVLHRWIASNLTVKGSKELLKFLTTQPTTPKQEMTFVMSMIQDGGLPYGTIRKTFRDYLEESVPA
jgi:hypothetical protein